LALKVWYNHVVTKRKIGAQFYTEIARTTPNEGILAIRSFGSTMIVLTQPETITTVLVNERLSYTKPPQLRKFLRPILGDGLVFLEGEEHRFGRKHTQPAFNKAQIHDLYPMMWGKAQEMVDVIGKTLEPGYESGKVEIVRWATRVSLDIIGLAGLGHDFHSLTDVKDKLAGDYEELTETTWGKLLWFLLMSRLSPTMTRFILPGITKTMEDRVASVRNLSTKMIYEKMGAAKNGDDGQFDILSLLISSNDFSEAQLTDHLLTLLVSG
jgi:cytochrome P450